MHVLIKLTNGDEVMGKLAIKEENSLELENALTLRYSLSTDGSPNMFFTKYCLFNKGMDVTFPSDSVMHVFKDLVPSLIDYYDEQVRYIRATLEEKLGDMKKKRTSEEQEEILFAMFEKNYNDTEIH